MTEAAFAAFKTNLRAFQTAPQPESGPVKLERGDVLALVAALAESLKEQAVGSRDSASTAAALMRDFVAFIPSGSRGKVEAAIAAAALDIEKAASDREEELELLEILGSVAGPSSVTLKRGGGGGDSVGAEEGVVEGEGEEKRIRMGK